MQTILPQYPKEIHQKMATSFKLQLLVSPIALKSVMHIFHHGLFPVYVQSWVPKKQASRLGMIFVVFPSCLYNILPIME